jgi:murein L,D-transpeptidase YafK
MATWRSTTERYTTARSSVTRSPAAARLRRVAGALLVAGVLAGCQADELGYGPKAQRPISADVKRKMGELDMKSTSPIMIRIFKEENQLEVWKQTKGGRYALLETFEICKWSGELGPKFKEGDRQAPEGFYEITPALMNPNSSYHLAFNLGYPNRYDRAHNRTGSHLMVHGACSSRGCYAMTDAQVQDIYALARESFKPADSGPSRCRPSPSSMTAENMAKHRGQRAHTPSGSMLKRGL